jgi:DNA-binding transcriptional MocR family regulator
MNRRRKEYTLRFVAIEHWLMTTDAWRSLDCVSRAAYIELKSRYAGRNNGRIPYSVLEMARALNVSKATALRALRRLQERGFIVLTKRGGFNLKTRHATEWRLTEYMSDVTGALPTKDFTRWKQNAVSPQHPTGTPVKPNGYPDEPLPSDLPRLRCQDSTRDAS